MAKNQLIDVRKREQCLKKITAQFNLREEPSVSPLYDDLIYTEYISSAQLAIDQLTPQRRRIFELRTQQDMTIDEISDSLHITRSAVKKQLYEAINFIKRHLHDHAEWPILLIFISRFF